MRLLQRLLSLLVLMSCTAGASVAYAQACTYNEAMMAFQQGNIVRGQALLTMAAKDGDERASALFAALREALQSGDSADVLRIVIAAEVIKKYNSDFADF